ncbi:MAG: hypothetical protein LBD20_02290, partial [Spirochaetaceae bacterium]|jgi:hypothetical protein|nr:hypothetical protein [Spirochaetaceae bacterium]
MVVYKNDKKTYEWVVEFKAYNRPQSSIDKDFEKMAVSKANCIWFHIFKNADTNTLKTILSKFEKAIKQCIKKHSGINIWKIVIVVLDEGRNLYQLDVKLNNKSYDAFNDSALFTKYQWDASKNKFIPA